MIPDSPRRPRRRRPSRRRARRWSVDPLQGGEPSNCALPRRRRTAHLRTWQQPSVPAGTAAGFRTGVVTVRVEPCSVRLTTISKLSVSLEVRPGLGKIDVGCRGRRPPPDRRGRCLGTSRRAPVGANRSCAQAMSRAGARLEPSVGLVELERRLSRDAPVAVSAMTALSDRAGPRGA